MHPHRAEEAAEHEPRRLLEYMAALELFGDGGGARDHREAVVERPHANQADRRAGIPGHDDPAGLDALDPLGRQRREQRRESELGGRRGFGDNLGQRAGRKRR